MEFIQTTLNYELSISGDCAVIDSSTPLTPTPFVLAVQQAAQSDGKLIYNGDVTNLDFYVGGSDIYKQLLQIRSITISGNLCGAFNNVRMKLECLNITGAINNSFNAGIIYAEKVSLNTSSNQNISYSFNGTELEGKICRINNPMSYSFNNSGIKFHSIDLINLGTGNLYNIQEAFSYSTIYVKKLNIQNTFIKSFGNSVFNDKDEPGHCLSVISSNTNEGFTSSEIYFDDIQYNSSNSVSLDFTNVQLYGCTADINIIQGISGRLIRPGEFGFMNNSIISLNKLSINGTFTDIFYQSTLDVKSLCVNGSLGDYSNIYNPFSTIPKLHGINLCSEKINISLFSTISGTDTRPIVLNNTMIKTCELNITLNNITPGGDEIIKAKNFNLNIPVSYIAPNAVGSLTNSTIITDCFNASGILENSFAGTRILTDKLVMNGNLTGIFLADSQTGQTSLLYSSVKAKSAFFGGTLDSGFGGLNIMACDIKFVGNFSPIEPVTIDAKEVSFTQFVPQAPVYIYGTKILQACLVPETYTLTNTNVSISNVSLLFESLMNPEKLCLIKTNQITAPSIPPTFCRVDIVYECC